MTNSLYKYLANDHDRISSLLEQAAGKGRPVDIQVYEEFRKALLRHISIEEKIAFPALIRLQGGASNPVLKKLRLDHGAIATLLVPQPTPSVTATLSSILSVHNAFEEQAGGIYEMLDRLAGADTRSLLEQFQAAPEVPVLPTKPLSQAIEAVRRAVARAGHEFIEKTN
jgi:hypothetical protein